MVYVTHKDARELRVTRYDGQQSTYPDSTALRKALSRAHSDLAEKIRARGDAEETFDPAVHFPEAIRRVDVSLPANQLGKSGAVLVDTPGLYARMRFGYDRMTREFRNSAACAVFVVKTDNLFLEQVFEEFGRLLSLFSRVFLVVNLDSKKRDLLPDGALSPSLEHDDPSKVIETFERLSMDAPLRTAYLEGKLKIYPVDLLRAASHRLRGVPAGTASPSSSPAGPAGPTAKGERGEKGETAKGTTGTPPGTSSAPGAAAAPAAPSAASEIADFEKFRDDLTTYLNSNEYLRSFLGDSMKHADALLRETGLLCDMGPVKDVASRVASLRADRETAKKIVDRVAVAQAVDWKAAFSGLRTRVADGTKDRMKEVRTKTADAVGGVLDRWFQSDKGLPSLVEEAGALFQSSLREAGPVVVAALKASVTEGSAGARLPFEVKQTLSDLEVSLDDAARKALDKVDPLAGLAVEKPAIAPDDVPVRRTWIDWLLLRGKGRIRRQVFGPPEAPNSMVAPWVKSARLGTAAREAMRSRLLAHLEGFFGKAFDAMVDRAFETYAPGVVAALTPEIAERRKEAEDLHKDAERKLADVENVVESLTRLRRSVDFGVSAIETLRKRHAETDPALLSRPIESAVDPESDAISRGRRASA